MATPTFSPNWGAIAQILGSALAAPQGQWAQGAQQGAQQYQGMQQQRTEQAYREQQMEFQRQEAAQRTAELQRKAQSDEGYKTLVGNLPGLTPEQRAYYMSAGAQIGYPLLGDQLFPKQPDAFKPNVEEFYLNGQKVKGYLDQSGQLVTVGDSVPLYKPEGAGIQVDTNGDGVPDITIGGGGMKPLSGEASQQTLRAGMIDQATKALGEINFDNVSAGKSAVGGWMSENPIGEAVAGQFVLNDDEKKLLGAQAMIQEATISAITGAAYTEEQKRNMRAALVPLATDSPTRKMEKLKSAAMFLRQLDKNSGYNRIVEQPTQGAADLKSKYGLE